MSLNLAELAELRNVLDSWAAMVSTVEEVEHVTDEELVLADRVVPLRRYTPAGADDAVTVWFHGGGYVAGTLNAIDPVCRWLASRAGTTVLSVDYRLAPEHPFPAALEDALAVLNAQSGRVAIGGDSAGGGLAAAAAALTSRPLLGLVLLCPWLDLTLSCPSVAEHGQEGLTHAALSSYADAYAGGADLHDPRLSPVLAPDLSTLPPTVIVTAERDPLRDEGELFAHRLSEAGVAVQVRRWPGQEHGFCGQTLENDKARESLDWAAAGLRKLL